MGDEAVLAGVLAALRQVDPAVTPVVLSRDPPGTARRHGVASVPRHLVGAWRALRGAEVLISGGGSLLQDITSARSPLYYLAVLEMARRAGALTVWFAQGIGPLRRPSIRRLVARAARQARLIVVRDEASRAELVSMGVDPALVRVAADAAWLLPVPGDERGVSSAGPSVPSEVGSRPTAAACLQGAGRPLRLGLVWRSWPGRPVGDVTAGQALGRALAARVRSSGCPAEVRVLAMQPQADREACRRLARACAAAYGEAAGPGRTFHAQAVEAPGDPRRFVELLADLDGVISARLHGLVLAAAAGVPFVGVAWDPKLVAFLKEMAWPLPALAPQRLGEAAEWEGALEALASQGAALREQLARSCELMRQRARQGAVWLAEVLQEAAEGRRGHASRKAAAAEARPQAPTEAPASGDPQAGPEPHAGAEAFAGKSARNRVSVLGVGVDRVGLEDAVARLADHLGTTPPVASGMQVVVTLNPEMVMHARRTPDFAAQLQAADLVVADGTGIVWAARLAGSPLPGRVPGIDLAERLLKVCAERACGVFLLGGRPGVAEEAARRLAQRLPGLVVVGTHHGYFTPGSSEEEALLAQLQQSRPDLVLVGMGSPRQELWLFRHRRRLQGCVRVAVGVGGSLDVWAARVRRAPSLFRRTGTEWLFRLITQPWRARRMAALPSFTVHAVLDAVRGCLERRLVHHRMLPRRPV